MAKAVASFTANTIYSTNSNGSGLSVSFLGVGFGRYVDIAINGFSSIPGDGGTGIQDYAWSVDGGQALDPEGSLIASVENATVRITRDPTLPTGDWIHTLSLVVTDDAANLSSEALMTVRICSGFGLRSRLGGSRRGLGPR